MKTPPRGKHPRAPLSGNARAILLLLGAVCGFTIMDATAKYLGGHYHPVQVVWARFAGNLLLFMVIYRMRVLRLLRTQRPGLQFSRAVMQIASISLFFASLQHIGLAEATAIMDLNPVLITLGAALFLDEHIGPRRIFGVVAAMIGALIIIRPGSGVFQAASLLPLLGAFTYAAGALLTRMAREDSVATTVMWSAALGTVALSCVVPFFWQPMAAQHWPAFLALAFFGTFSQWLLVQAFAQGEAAVVAPFGYTGLLWAGFWGWLIFGQIPDGWTIIGAGIIVAAGLYIWSREYASMRRPI